jgi:DNA-binding XRE family transcriptional regulator
MKNKTLQDLRLAKGLTIEQAAKILEISKQYLSMLENGHRNPSDSLKMKMAKLYDCDIIDIYLAVNSTKRLKRKEVN